MGKKVYDTMIPRNVRISEAPSHGKPVLVYDLKCVGSEAYLKLATEVIQRERELRRIDAVAHPEEPAWRASRRRRPWREAAAAVRDGASRLPHDGNECPSLFELHVGAEREVESEGDDGDGRRGAPAIGSWSCKSDR